MKNYSILFLILFSANIWAQSPLSVSYPYIFNPNVTAEEVARYNKCVGVIEAELIKQADGNPGKFAHGSVVAKMVETRCSSILKENDQKVINDQAKKLTKDAQETIRKEQEAYKKQQSDINKNTQSQINEINKQNQKDADASPKLFIGNREIIGGGPTGLMYKDNKAPVQTQDLSKMVEK